MKKLFKSGRTIICAVLLLFVMGISAEASDGTISFSDPSAYVGDKVPVSVKVKTNGCYIGATDITLTYDPSALEFVSGGSTASGGAGSVHIAGVAGDAETNSVTYKLTFKTLSPGSSKIEVSNYEIYDFDENLVSMSHVGNSTVSASDGTPDASSDATLSSLTVSKGSLSPAFAPKTYKYTMTVGSDVTSLAIDAKTNDSKATVSSITGADSLQPGENTVKVKVTAENGDTATYKITVTREKESEEEDTPEETTEPENTDEPQESENPEESEAPEESEEPEETESAFGTVVVNGKTLTPAEFPEDADIPGFTLSTLEYNGVQQPAFVSKYMEYYVLYMTDTEGNSDYYAYYKDIDTFTEFVQLTSGTTGNMFILDGYVSDLTESGFVKAELEIAGKKLTGWAYGEAVTAVEESYKDFYLVAGVNQDGLLTWYQYDAQEGTYQRFVAQKISTDATTSSDAEEVQVLETQLKELTDTYQSMKSKRLMMIIALGFLDLILLIVIVNLIFKLRDKDGYDDEDDAWTEEYEDEDGFTEEDAESDYEPEDDTEEMDSLDEEERYQQDIEDEEPVQRQQTSRFRKSPILEKKSLVKETQDLFDDDDEEEFDFEIIDLDDDEK